MRTVEVPDSFACLAVELPSYAPQLVSTRRGTRMGPPYQTNHHRSRAQRFQYIPKAFAQRELLMNVSVSPSKKSP